MMASAGCGALLSQTRDGARGSSPGSHSVEGVGVRDSTGGTGDGGGEEPIAWLVEAPAALRKWGAILRTWREQPTYRGTVISQL